MRSNLLSLFLKSSSRSVLFSGINFASTILLVRWFGESAYVSYTIDLSVISLLLIVLEAIPSNYSLFRIQDSQDWKECVALQTCITVLVACLLVSFLGLLSVTRSFSYWMAVYAAVFVVKRYMDIILQAQGKLYEYFNLEIIASCVKLALMTVFFWQKVDSSISIWSSIAVSYLLVQGYWVLKHREEANVFVCCFNRKTVKKILEATPLYKPYYIGIVLKRIKDNLVPLAAERVLVTHESLAAFFLAYRGIVFSVGQMRIIEALLNHRDTLLKVDGLSAHKQRIVVLIAQAMCIFASWVLLYASGASVYPWREIFVLSLMVWPLSYLMLERSRAYSAFKAGNVSWSISAYIIAVLLGCACIFFFSPANGVLFCIALLVAEFASLAVLRSMRKENVDAR